MEGVGGGGGGGVQPLLSRLCLHIIVGRHELEVAAASCDDDDFIKTDVYQQKIKVTSRVFCAHGLEEVETGRACIGRSSKRDCVANERGEDIRMRSIIISTRKATPPLIPSHSPMRSCRPL